MNSVLNFNMQKVQKTLLIQSKSFDVQDSDNLINYLLKKTSCTFSLLEEHYKRLDTFRTHVHKENLNKFELRDCELFRQFSAFPQ